jgi:DNA-binding LacI/PurR family transcriptional regulator
MVSYLISLGHRRIAHFSGPESSAGSIERLSGYRNALEDAGIEFDPSIVFPGHYYIESGRQSAQRFADRYANAASPTAIFCANDAIASGAVQVLHDRGIRIPEEISIAGFDDCLVAHTTVRRLTTVRQPLRTMGYAALELLLEQIDTSQPSGAQAVLGRNSGETIKRLVDTGTATPDCEKHTLNFQTEIVIRESTGPPRAG